jgi:hypothetical protein
MNSKEEKTPEYIDELLNENWKFLGPLISKQVIYIFKKIKFLNI